jgi:excisionase family DNA binding protein
MQVDGTRVYRVKDIAERFDVHRSTIYRAIESGQLDAIKIGAGTGKGALRVPESALLAWLGQCGTAAGPSTTRPIGDHVAAHLPVSTGEITAPAPAERATAMTVLDGLTDAQADGLACVVCAVNFLHPGSGSHVPVGRSHTGSQVFACTSHTPAAVREATARRRALLATSVAREV